MNWGVIGCASIAQRSVIPALLSIDKNKLVAVSSRRQTMADALAKQFTCVGVEGYEELLKRTDIDAVYIPLPNGLHHEWIMQSLKYGKHVLVEKAAFTSYAEAKEAVDLARSKGLAIVENFQFQYHSQHAFVKELLAKGELGEIRCFRSSFGFPPFDAATNIRYKSELGGGALLDSGAYVLKATSFMLGNSFDVTSSFLNYHKDYNVDWYGGAFLVSRERGLFSEVAFGFENYYQCNYEIWGSKGKITSTRAFTAKADYAPTVTLEKDGKANEIILAKDDHFRNLLLQFNKAIEERKIETELDNILHQAKLIDEVQSLAVKS